MIQYFFVRRQLFKLGDRHEKKAVRPDISGRVAYQRFRLLVDDHRNPSCVAKKDPPINSYLFIACDTEFLNEALGGSHGGQCGKEIAVSQSALDDVIRMNRIGTVDKEQGVAKDLGDPLDIRR